MRGKSLVRASILGLLGSVALVGGASGDDAKVLAQLAHSRATYTTAEAWAERTRVIREDFLKGYGLWPLPARPAVKAIAHGRRERDGYSIENVALETMPGFYCTGNLYRPLHQSAPGPAILCALGHFTDGRYEPDQQRLCAQFARMGATVFSYSMVGRDDSRQTDHEDPLAFPLHTWNSLRAADYVLGLPDVDPGRLGMTGASGGGTQTLFLGLFEPRVRAIAPVVIVGLNAGGCICEAGNPWTYTNDVEVAAMIAPRPQLLVSVGHDFTRDFPAKGFPFVEHFYQLAGAGGAAASVHLADEGHDYGPSKRKAVYEFFAQHLKMPLIAEDAGTIAIEPPDRMEAFNAAHPLPAHAVKGREGVAAAFAALRRGGE